MPVPPEYQRARDDFYNFLLDARDTAGLGTTHQGYTMVQGVFQTFRRRLDLKVAIRFAGCKNLKSRLIDNALIKKVNPAEL